MSDRVLPAFLVLLIEWKLANDVAVDLAERQPAIASVFNRHRYQSDI